MREVALAVDAGAEDAANPVEICVVAVPGGWAPDAWCLAEIERLAPHLDVRFADLAAIEPGDGVFFVDGAGQVPAAALQAVLDGRGSGHAGIGRAAGELLRECRAAGEGDDIARLDAASRALVAATSKPGDGIVSRYINRPISQSITSVLLKYPGVTPFQATCGTAALALAMAVCLFFGGAWGLIAGSLLFQAASIFDGVDGEIARATFRSSARGAMLDSLIDAATNLAFIAGVTTNFWFQGYTRSAAAGGAGLVMLAVGLYLLGRRARAGHAPFSFNAVKDHFSGRKSRLMQWMTWLTMRDFFALAGAILILTGYGAQGLVAFATVTAGWFLVVMSVLFRRTT